MSAGLSLRQSSFLRNSSQHLTSLVSVTPPTTPDPVTLPITTKLLLWAWTLHFSPASLIPSHFSQPPYVQIRCHIDCRCEAQYCTDWRIHILLHEKCMCWMISPSSATLSSSKNKLLHSPLSHPKSPTCPCQILSPKSLSLPYKLWSPLRSPLGLLLLW